LLRYQVSLKLGPHHMSF